MSRSDERLKSRVRNRHTSHTLVVRQNKLEILEIPNDEEEVNTREIHSAMGERTIQTRW
jgi:hypothetical protein